MDTTTYDIEAAAHAVYAMILEDIETQQLPKTVADFGELHSYCDANDYLFEAAVPWGSDIATDEDPYGMRLQNAVCDRINEMLAGREVPNQNDVYPDGYFTNPLTGREYSLPARQAA